MSGKDYRRYLVTIFFFRYLRKKSELRLHTSVKIDYTDVKPKSQL